MEDLFRMRLNGKHVLSLTRFKTVDEMEKFFSKKYNSKICLMLCNNQQIFNDSEIFSFSDPKIECFSETFDNGNNIFIYHHYRAPYVYYRCKKCRKNAFFKDGKFQEKHLSKCRRIKSFVLIESNKEAETYFVSKASTSEVTFDNTQCDSDSLNCSNTHFSKLINKSEEVTDYYFNSNEVFSEND